MNSTERLRIAIHHNLEEGGALRALRDFSEYLGRDNDITWVLINQPSSPEVWSVRARLIELSPSGPLYPFHKWTDLWNLRQIERASKKLAKRIDEGGFDIAFLHPCRFGQAPAILRYLETSTVYYCPEPLRLYREGVPFRDGAPGSLLFRMGRLLFRPIGRWLDRRDSFLALKADTILTNSEYSAGRIDEVYGRRAIVVRPGIDTDLFRPDPGVPREKIVLSVGKLVERKGHFFAVEIIGAIPAEARPKLIVAGFPGSRSFQSRLNLAARSAGVDLEIVTDLTDKDVVRLYNRAWVTLSVSELEPYGLVSLESQASGTPVLARDEAGHRETVSDGETGFLFPPEPNRFAAQIALLMSDPDLTERMGRAARRHAESVAGRRMAGERLRNVIEEIISHG